VVKEFATGLRGAIVDLARGSPARRAWRAGRGLAALGIGAAPALAFLEHRRLGLAFTSVLVQEDLCPALAADSPGPEAGAAARTDALVRLALALHSAGAAHRDLTAGNLLLVRDAHGLSARLVDLEDARLPRSLGDRARAHALAQLNASLPDWIPAALRRRAFLRYATWLPFRAPRARVLTRIVAASLARRHHWSGRGCLPDEPRSPSARRAEARSGRGLPPLGDASLRAELHGSSGPSALARVGLPAPQEAEMVIQRKELEEPGMRPPLPTS
jgi:hypothetical protein